MPADALKCKECQTTYPLEARFVCERCFGPLEVSYTLPDGDPAALKRRIQAGPHTIWRYADFLPLEGPARSALPTGWTPLVKADRLAEQARARRAVHQERDREPDALVQGPRRLRRAGPCTGARVRHARVCQHGQPRERRRGPRRGRRDARVRADPARPRGAEGPRHRRLRRADRGRPRQLRRRQPALHRGVRRAAGLGVREHQHAPVLRRGLQDARVRDRRAARLGAAGPDRRADRLRLAVHEDRARLPGVHRRRARLRLGAGHERRPGARAARRSRRRSPRAPTSAGPSSRTRSPSRWRSATRPTARTRSSSRAQTGGAIDAVDDDEIRAGIRLLAETTGIFTETAGGVTIATLAKLAARGDIGRDERVVAMVTGDGLKTIDAVRGHVRGDRDPGLAGGLRRALRAGGGLTWRSRSSSRRSCATPPAARRRWRSTAARWGRRSRASTRSTASCASGSPTATAACAGSSTCT